MNRETVRVLFLHELRMLMRDRRTVIMAVVLPLLIMPIMFYGTKKMNDRREARLHDTTYFYAVTGTEQEAARALVASGRRAAAVEVPGKGEGSISSYRFVEKKVADPDAALRAKEIHFYLLALSGTEADAMPPLKTEDGNQESEKASKRGREGDLAATARRLPGVPLIRIYFQADRDDSQSGHSRMRELLDLARESEREALLLGHGFPLKTGRVIAVESSSLASAGQVSGSWLGRFLTIFVVMFMLTGGSVVAMDIVAGEKERGSLETLLTTAAGRGEIVAAKQLTIISVALVITFIQVVNILVYVSFKAIELPKDFVIEVPPATVATLLVLFVPVAASVAAVLLLLSSYAKSFKEAQLYFFPVYLVSLVPSLAAVLPGISLRSAIVVVPLANISVAVREIMVGKFDWPMIGLAFVAMSGTAAWMVRASARMLSREDLITSSETDAADFAGGPALFPKHVLRWYALLGVIMFGVALNVPQLATFKRQLLFNEVFLFLCGPLLMIRRYRLNIREALAIRRVHPAVWIAIFFAIPSGYLLAVGVFKLANLVLPVPKQVLEQFGRDLLPANIPTWQLYLFLSVIPGICEEIAFRGTLLYGLRRKMRPLALALAVGLIFGLFHVTLFRIVPTAFLGVFLTGIALLTGSIIPCMLMHAGNNAFGLWASQAGFAPELLDWWTYAAAGVVFALCFYILFRTRTPYPGLRKMHG